MTAKPVWIVDAITVRPGQGPAFLKAYMEQYVPGAVSRGMTLAHRMVEPAMWLVDEPNRLLFVWTVPDAGTVWTSKHVARMDPAVSAWWAEEAPAFILSRRRSIMADADALGGLANV